MHKSRYRKRNFKCPIFGIPKDLSELVLPTYGDVLKCLLFESNQLREKNNGKNPSSNEAAELVSCKIEQIFDKILIPRYGHNKVKQKIIKYYGDYLKIKKVCNRIIKSEHVKNRLNKFKKDALKLFDISACKCKFFDKCKCPKEKKVPESERDFLLDQRNKRRRAIGSVDRVRTKKLKRKLERQAKDSSRSKKLRTESSYTHENSTVSSDSSSDDQPNSEETCKQDSSAKPSSSNQMRLQLSNTAAACVRFGISHAAGAAVATSVLQDLGIISDQVKSLVIDPSKIKREKEKIAKKIKSSERTDTFLRGLYFDGRHDNTKTLIKIGSTTHQKLIKEDHYSLVQEPGSEYIGHVTPKSGSAKDISTCIISYIQEEIPETMNSIEAVGCDGTVVNTGNKGGVIRHLEVKVGRSLQWFICLLHFNELPLRHLFQKLDGVSSGPNTYCGPIGKELKDCLKKIIVTFEAIECNLPEIDPKILSADQKYLYKICKAINSGFCPQDLANLEPGNLCHSRWLTAANRTLRVYVSTEIPSENLKVIVKFILKVYAPSWFRIKMNGSVKDGSKHLFQFIKSSRYLEKKYLDIIDPVIQRNAFFAHPENILLAMLTDKDADIRQLALKKIHEAKIKSLSSENEIRQFEVPTLNFEAVTYTEIIDWSGCEVFVPPALKNLKIDEIEKFLEDNEVPSTWDFVEYPCHTQAVERTVKLVTEASSKVYGQENRDNHIKTILKSRSSMPSFKTKKDFQALKL